VTRAELDDERAFLLASLEDLEHERAAGDLSDGDYDALRDRYTRRAAEVLRALDPGPAGLDGTAGRAGTGVCDAAIVPDGAPGADGAPRAADASSPGPAPRRARGRRSRRRRTMAVVGVLALLAAVAVLMVTMQAGARLPGQTASGSVSLSPAEQTRQTLAQAETLEASGDAAQALQLFQQVLARDPTQVEALAESGWLEFEAGVSAKDAAVLSRAQQVEQSAERADPGAYAPHLYLGSMLLAEGDAKGAVTEYRRFLAADPPKGAVEPAEPFIKDAFTQAGRPLPALPPPGTG